FPPNHPIEEIVELVRARGEPAAWRGDPAFHRRLVLGNGLEVRIDRQPEQKHWSVLPYFQPDHRLRVAVDEIRALPDSPFDALMIGWAAPPVFEELRDATPGAYRLSLFLTDARRLPPRMPRGHVLAVNVAAFALDVDYVGPDEGAFTEDVPGREGGASIVPLGSPEDPGGCAEVSLRVRRVTHLVNPYTEVKVAVLEVEAPERPLHLFVSRWQLEQDGLAEPRPGWRIEGTFFFIGRIAGGLPKARVARDGFG
ncbi:MAG: hypothetical protein HZA53_19550, partial [Planctomycetes bacterium]|nr:hypothetical protein [Planctomycetota bacterium]